MMAFFTYFALPWQLQLLALLLGLSVGSFLNVVIWRLPREEGVAAGRSHCPACKHSLGVFDLFPVLSFLLLRGKCRYCGVKISWRYPLVELATGALFLAALWQYGLSLASLGLCWFFAVLVAISLIDYDWKIIPDELLLAGLPAAVVLGLAHTSPGWLSLLLGGGIGFLLLLSIVLISRGGMGGGDVKLAGLLGLCLGWKLLIIALMTGFVAGGVVGAVLLLTRRKGRKDEVPFGPFLAMGGIIAALAGPWLWNWYWNFLLL